MSEPSLLPPNATPQERAFEAMVAERFAAINADIRATRDPMRCPVDFLPFLAWEKSVDSWSSDWPEAVKRSVIANSFSFHKRKGTRAVVEEVITALGGAVEIVEWFEKSPAGTPGTFELNMVASDEDGNPVSADYQQSIIDAVIGVKRLSAHFTVNLGVSVVGGVKVLGFTRQMVFTRLQITADRSLPVG